MRSPLYSPKWGLCPRSKSADLASAPTRRALRPSTPGDFLPDEKVTKESPRGGDPSGYSPEGDAIAPPAALRAASPSKDSPIGCRGEVRAFFSPPRPMGVGG